jgi:hypothetical protein
MMIQLPMMFESFDDRVGYPSFTPSTGSAAIVTPSPILNSVKIEESPVDVSESTYTILPWRPFGSNPLGWAVSNVLLKGAEALMNLRPDEATAY